MGLEGIMEVVGAHCYSTELNKNMKFGKLVLRPSTVTWLKRRHPTGKDGDNERNEELYAELVQFLDDKSLSLIMR